MEARPRIVRLYQRADGVVPFTSWYKKLRDVRGQQKILARVDRASLGNLGDHRSVGEGVSELKIDFGPGYRVYLGFDGDTVIVLLIGGDKSTQDDDIKKAKSFWKEYKEGKRYADG